MSDKHMPFDDDGVTYCGWATGTEVIDGCGKLWPCSELVRRYGPIENATRGVDE